MVAPIAKASRAAQSLRGLLTATQRKVVGLLAEQAASNAEIAAALGISPRTAKYHVVAIIRALGLRNREEVIIRYWRGRVKQPRSRSKPPRR